MVVQDVSEERNHDQTEDIAKRPVREVSVAFHILYLQNNTPFTCTAITIETDITMGIVMSTNI